MIARRPRRVPAQLVASALVASVLHAGCDRMGLLAPTAATIVLVASALNLPVNGSTEIVATVIEQSGTPVHNGTVVTFSTTRGTIDPAEARTQDGKVTVRLFAGSQSGLARVSAFSGGARAEAIEVRIGGAAVTAVNLRASPAVVSATRGGNVQLIASVTDENGGGLFDVLVTFTTSAGRLSTATATTDGDGNARATLTTSRDTTVTATAGNQTDEVTIEATSGPTVDVDLVTTNPTEDAPVQFTVTVTAGDAPVRNVTINFGDGTSKSLGNLTGSVTISHVYTSSGAKTVTVTAVDEEGERTVVSTQVVIEEKGAIPVTLAASPNPANPNELVTFTATVGTVTGVIERYEWTFGDGSNTTTTGNIITHVYKKTGTYTAKLRVRATEGQRGEAQTVVIVESAGSISVTLDTSPDAPTAGDVVTFTATVPTGTTVEQYEWDFGDGTTTTTTGNTVTHAYDAAGTYQATVTVSTTQGQSGNAETTVIVAP